MPRLDIVGSPHGHETEECEDQDIAQSQIAQRPRAARIGISESQRAESDQDDRPSPHGYQINAEQESGDKAKEATGKHRRGRHQSALSDSNGSQAFGSVRSPFEVVVVVDEVRS